MLEPLLNFWGKMFFHNEAEGSDSSAWYGAHTFKTKLNTTAGPGAVDAEKHHSPCVMSKSQILAFKAFFFF